MSNIGRTAGEAVELSKLVQIVIVRVPGLDSDGHLMLEPKTFREQCQMFATTFTADEPLVSEIRYGNTLVIGGAPTISKQRESP